MVQPIATFPPILSEFLMYQLCHRSANTTLILPLAIALIQSLVLNLWNSLPDDFFLLDSQVTFRHKLKLSLFHTSYFMLLGDIHNCGIFLILTYNFPPILCSMLYFCQKYLLPVSPLIKLLCLYTLHRIYLFSTSCFS